MYFIYRKRFLVYSFLISLLIFVTINFVRDFELSRTKKIIVFNSRRNSVISIDANEDILIADRYFFDNNKNSEYLLKPYLQATKRMNRALCRVFIDDFNIRDTILNPLFVRNNFMQVGNFRFLLVSNDTINRYNAKQKIKLDYLILSKNVNINVSDLMKYFKFRKLIFDSSNKLYRVSKWIKECEKLQIPYHDVNSEGSWIFDYIHGKEKEI